MALYSGVLFADLKDPTILPNILYDKTPGPIGTAPSFSIELIWKVHREKVFL
jgi:hypothetical protein